MSYEKCIMLIFNREEVENSYKEQDNEILQIESCLSLREFTQKLQNMLYGREDGLRPDDYEMHLFRSGVHRQATWQHTIEDASDDTLYHHTFDPESESGLDEVAVRRNQLYEEFERFTFGQNHDFAEVPTEHIFEHPEHECSLESIYRDCLDACGVMPTLHEADLPIKQMQDMSYMGRSLYFPWEDLTSSNRLPTREDLELFYGLNPYECAVITDSLHNPTRLLDIIKAVRALHGYQNFVITEEFIAMAAKEHSNCSAAEFTQLVETGDDLLYTELVNNPDYQALNDAFVARWRRAPRILPEIYYAYHCRYGAEAPLSAEQIQQIVSDFKLSNIQKVASMHNPTLLLLSGDLNFDEIKKEHLQIFATYLSVDDYRYAKENGFFAWYDRYKREIKTSDLCNIVRGMKKLHFDLELNPKELLRLDSQVRGWCNAACVYQQYGIDFRNAVVAIPGRGLVVEDKVQKLRMYILDRDDARIFTVGQDCHCCQNLAVRGDQTYGNYYSGEIMNDLLAQHFTNINDAYDYVAAHYSDGRQLITPGAGGSCVANELTHPLAWVTIWEDTVTGNTVAQADTHYVADTNTLVYDNIEFVNDGNVKKLYDIIAVYAEQSQYDSIHIGTGYNQGMLSFGKRIATKEMQKYREDTTEEFKEKFRGGLYSDYSSSAVKVKQDGEMLIFPKKGPNAFHIEHRPEDNEQYRYLTHPISLIFSGYTIQQKQNLIERFEAQNLTEEEMLTVARKKPELLAEFETLSLPVQQQILFPAGTGNAVDMSAFKYVRHPDSLLLQRVLDERPDAIRFFDEEYLSRENWLSVLTRDGSLAEYCPTRYLDEEVVSAAIRSNPFSIKYVADRLEEPLRSRMIIMSVYKKPILAAHFPHLPEYVWVHICENKGQFGRYCPNQTYRVQQAMISSSVYNIDYIRNPDPRILQTVEQTIPSLRSNPRYASFFGNQREVQNTNRSNRVEQTPAHARREAFQYMMQVSPDFPEQAENFDMDEVS